MIHYHPVIIHQVATRLYRHAHLVTLGWLAIGLVIGYYVGGAFLRNGQAGIVVGGCLGVAIGLERALMLKFQAQLALCQVEIEQGVRTLAGAGAAQRMPRARNDNECGKCGSQLVPDAQFSRVCGSKVPQRTPEAIAADWWPVKDE